MSGFEYGGRQGVGGRVEGEKEKRGCDLPTGCFVRQVDQQGSQKEIVLKRMDTVRADLGHALEARVCAQKCDVRKQQHRNSNKRYVCGNLEAKPS